MCFVSNNYYTTVFIEYKYKVYIGPCNLGKWAVEFWEEHKHRHTNVLRCNSQRLMVYEARRTRSGGGVCIS